MRVVKGAVIENLIFQRNLNRLNQKSIGPLVYLLEFPSQVIASDFGYKCVGKEVGLDTCLWDLSLLYYFFKYVFKIILILS